MNGKTAIAVAVPFAPWTEALAEAPAWAQRAARAALAGARRDGAPVPDAFELSLVLADGALMRRLNRDYRRKDKPTNVLSFPGYDAGALARLAGKDAKGRGRDGAPVLLGDVVLAFEVVRDEAAAQGKSLADHLAHLVVHGTLHLLGYDHERGDEAEKMERLEVAVLGELGIADPYGDGEAAGPAAVAGLAKVGGHG